ncbi:Single-stranded DNA-binding protein [Acidisarcina polymorpha]|uniref:Single-stranded DNA-binding protein n=1 Tax=Acidisarcina polymorpha TaxID=2211140 RepID=A0A2Z5G7H3_9BACT|nr:single-stranded DNA-binding protein [Acidisarcina polymorpha]AXC15202.1 Single-stranded DNA-binding protein [Acidisarcina polymorpha]
MAKSVNKVILLGNVGKDPEFKMLPSGQGVANFSIATAERFKDKGGEWQERTEWHNLVAYARLAEIIRDYVKKGTKLYVEGRLTTRSWDDKESGKKVYRTEVVMSELSLLSGRGEGDGGSGGNYSRSSSSAASSSSFDQRPSGSPDDYAHSTEITDDDIPF